MAQEQLFAQLAEILEVDEAEVNADLGLTDLGTWDSLAVVSTIVAVQQLYDVNLDAAALADCATVGDILEAIAAASSEVGMSDPRAALAGKHILVTGASSGLGRATALLLSQAGARVALCGRDERRLAETWEQLAGEGHSRHVMDLTDLEPIPDRLRAVAADHGSLDGLFHAAGVELTVALKTTSPTQIADLFRVNFDSAILLAKGFAHRAVRSSGPTSVVFMSSVAAHLGTPGETLYGASKAALEAAVRALACELAPRSIRVNALAAAGVATPMLDAILARLTFDARADFERRHLLGFGQPADVAAAAAFLLSDAARWITGTVLVVDGGYSCH